LSNYLSLKELEQQYGSGIRVKLSPGGNLRKKGTLQRGQVEISARARGYEQTPLYLVVSCNRKWAKLGECDTQRYALVVSLSHTNTEVDLYNQLRVKTRIAERIRIR
jgi:3-deoxy-D-arabino-heptulosonate 7-phosphate (DAHP) synthase